MITITQAIHDVEVAIRTCKNDEPGNYCLVVLNSKIYCQPQKSTSADATILANLTKEDREKGCRSEKWNEIEGEIKKLIKGNIL